MTTERRRRARLPLTLSVTLTNDAGHTWQLVTRDISIEGVLLAADPKNAPPLSPRSEVILQFHTRPAASIHRLRARVQRVSPGGVALIFIGVSMDDVNYLDTLIRQGATGDKPPADAS